MSDSASLSTAIAEQTARFNALRLQKDADPTELEDAKKKLGDLKKALGEINRANAAASKASSSAADAKKRERMLLKTAKVCMIQSLDSIDLILIARAQEIMDQQKTHYASISKISLKNASSDMADHASIPQSLRGKIFSPANMEKTPNSSSI